MFRGQLKKILCDVDESMADLGSSVTTEVTWCHGKKPQKPGGKGRTPVVYLQIYHMIFPNFGILIHPNLSRSCGGQPIMNLTSPLIV